MRARRGNNAIEFALTLPIYLILLSGIVDYGWYFNQHMVVTMVARDSARAASLQPLGDDDVELAGEAQGQASLEASGLEGEVECTLTGASPDQSVACQVDVGFTALFGLAPVAGTLSATTTMRMEEQPAEEEEEA